MEDEKDALSLSADREEKRESKRGASEQAREYAKEQKHFITVHKIESAAPAFSNKSGVATETK